MTAARSALVRARRAAGWSQERLAREVGVDRSTVQRWEAGRTSPQPRPRFKLAAALGLAEDQLDVVLGEPESGLGFRPPCRRGDTAPHLAARRTPDDLLDDPPAPALVDGGDEVEALELARRVAATDVGDTTVTQLEQAVDDLASSYATTPPRELLDRTRTHLRYITRLLDGRATLREQRRLLVAGGWLSLLAGTLHVDVEQHGPAVARLRTADTLAGEAGHAEIRAWCLETAAWRVLTLGDHRRAVTLAQAAQQAAPAGTSALIQATAQEGRAWARLGDARATTRAVGRVNRAADPLPRPDRAEHHYRYDPAKATSYTATTLSWVGDPAAVDYAREVIANLSRPDDRGGRPRRLAVARLDLALALLAQGQVDEAADSALAGILSGHVAPSNRWRAAEVVRSTESAGTRAAPGLRAAFRELLAP